jgi:hypothetical protein
MRDDVVVCRCFDGALTTVSLPACVAGIPGLAAAERLIREHTGVQSDVGRVDVTYAAGGGVSVLVLRLAHGARFPPHALPEIARVFGARSALVTKLRAHSQRIAVYAPALSFAFSLASLVLRGCHLDVTDVTARTPLAALVALLAPEMPLHTQFTVGPSPPRITSFSVNYTDPPHPAVFVPAITRADPAWDGTYHQLEGILSVGNLALQFTTLPER